MCNRKRRDLQNQIEITSTKQTPKRIRLTEAKLAKLSTAVRTGLANADPDMRKAYIKLFVDKVIVSKTEIRLSGPRGVLAKAALETLPNTPGEVITFVRKWRPTRDKTGHWKSLFFHDL